MAFQWQTFKTRALTAVIFVAVMLGGLLYNHWSFLLLFTIIHFGCWIEYQKIVALIDPNYKQITPFHRYGVMLAGFGFMLWMTNDAFNIGPISLAEIGWWTMLIFAVVLPVTETLFSKDINYKVIAHSFLGLVYISLSWGLMMSMRSNGIVASGSEISFDLGWIIPITLIAAIWINDTMAYIVGSIIGKTPLSPISPKKTWEGTVGGAIIAVAAITASAHYLFKADTVSVMVIASIGAVMGTLGDLFESKLKRLAGIKDSGQIMPGHGGFLDRFDSLLLATPFVWLYVKFFL
jgi:phosphatidate cytidylyltransferase